MLSHILVASDGSEASDRMVDCVKAFRGVGTERVTLTHVFNVHEVGGLYQQLKTAMLPKLEAERQVLEAAGIQVTVETRLGMPFIEIVRMAEERKASAIAVGSLGASLVADVLLGSTAYAVVRTATLPVLLIRIEITDGGDAGKRCRALCDRLPRHILFPTDFSDTSERAVLYLEHMVRETQSEVTLLHIQDKTRIDPHLRHRLEEFNQIDTDRLEHMRLHLEACGAKVVHVEISYGSPTALILERARSDRYSLILMGSQGRGFIHEVFLGSVANNVARQAALPVLFVPAVR